MTSQISRSFRPFFTLCFASCLAASTLSAQSPRAAATGPALVEMRSISFFPKSLTIQEGQSVVWKNVSYTDHSASSDDGKSFDTDMVPPKSSSKALLFSKAGRYSYHCKMHGRSMSALIIVKGTKP